MEIINEAEYNIEEFIVMFCQLSDRGKREVCHLISLLSFYEERIGKKNGEDEL